MPKGELRKPKITGRVVNDPNFRIVLLDNGFMTKHPQTGRDVYISHMVVHVENLTVLDVETKKVSFV